MYLLEPRVGVNGLPVFTTNLYSGETAPKMLTLPAEIVFCIADFIGVDPNIESILCLMQVNKRLRILLFHWKGFSALRMVRRSRPGASTIINRLFKFVIPNLKVNVYRFDANGYPEFKDWHLRSLSATTPSLESLDLRGCNRLTEECMIEYFQTACPNCPACFGVEGSSSSGYSADTTNKEGQSHHIKPLKQLILSYIPRVTNRVLAVIGERCSNLELLNIGQLRYYKFDDDGIKALLHYSNSNLMEIDLFGCDNLSDASLFAIAKGCPKLEILNVKGCFLIGNPGVQSIMLNCLQIRHLDISYCWRLTDELFSVILSTSASTSDNSILADSIVAAQRLSYLQIEYCYQLGDPTLAYLSRLSNLQMISCAQCPAMTVETKRMISRKIMIADS